MKLPSAVKDIRKRFIAKFPIPQGAPGAAFEETVRQWTIRHAEQVAFELPGQGWGVKRADGGRPICKDCIAFITPSTLLVWDNLIGAGTGAPVLNPDPDSEEIPDQIFVPVAPTNHLGTTPPQPPHPPGGTDPPDLDADAIRAFMARTSASLERVEKKLDLLSPSEPPPPATGFPNYEGSVSMPYLGSGKVALKPVKP